MIYLDNAATSLPKPAAVSAYTSYAIDSFGNPGRSGHGYAIEAGRALYDTRCVLSTLLGIDEPLRLAFTYSATDALNQAIQGMYVPGAHYVVTAAEHNSVLRCVNTLCADGSASYTVIPCDALGYIKISDIEKALLPQTVLVCLNHASNVTGAVQDITGAEEICRKKGVPLLIDASQSIGHSNINMKGYSVAMAAFPSHKSLLGPQGAGGLYIPQCCSPTPLRQGGTGSSTLELTQPQDMPERYESGTAATPAIFDMKAGCEYVLWHKNEIEEKEKRLTQALWEGLSRIDSVRLYGPKPGMPRNAVVSFNVGDMGSDECADALWESSSIACRGGLHCAPLLHKALGTQKSGAVRFSIGAFNTIEDIEGAIEAVYALSIVGIQRVRYRS